MHKLTLEADASQGLRRGRAAVASPYFGDYEFQLDKGSSSGIVVLTTSKGLHKISYDVKYTEASIFEADIQVSFYHSTLLRWLAIKKNRDNSITRVMNISKWEVKLVSVESSDLC